MTKGGGLGGGGVGRKQQWGAIGKHTCSQLTAATPILSPESSGLPPRPWSGSQDSQLGGPPPGVSSPPQPPPPIPSVLPPPPPPPRTRRSNSSEALIDWGGVTPDPPPESSRSRCVPPSAEQRRSQKWLALEGLRDWYLRHMEGPQNVPPPPPPPQPPRPQPPAWPPPRRRDPPGLPHSLSYAGALTPRYGGYRGYRAPLF